MFIYRVSNLIYVIKNNDDKYLNSRHKLINPDQLCTNLDFTQVFQKKIGYVLFLFQFQKSFQYPFEMVKI